MNDTARRFLIAFGAAVGAVLLVLALLSASSSASEESEATPTPTPSAEQEDLAEPVGLVTDAPTHAQAAEVGDCYLLGEAEATWGMANVRFVDCAEPHHGQLVASTVLAEQVPVDVNATPSSSPLHSSVDFAVEFCVLEVWGDPADLDGTGSALYFPADLVVDGLADEVMCARETLRTQTGSALG